jgi:hypothetical protein
MSTTKLRKALEMMGHLPTTTFHDRASLDNATALLADARAELEAIERAAEERAVLAEEIAEGDKAALERLAEMACDERNAAIDREAAR